MYFFERFIVFFIDRVFNFSLNLYNNGFVHVVADHNSALQFNLAHLFLLVLKVAFVSRLKQC